VSFSPASNEDWNFDSPIANLAAGASSSIQRFLGESTSAARVPDSEGHHRFVDEVTGGNLRPRREPEGWDAGNNQRTADQSAARSR
jgi:hypothetical protein